MPARRFALAVLFAVILAACSGRPERPVGPRPLYSPLGEYLGTARGAACVEALGAWFDRVDTNRDGRIDAAEHRAEAARLFAVFDADGDGFMTPQELLTARRAAAPAAAEPPPAPGARRRGPSIDTSPDPVMAADLNLDFRVSRAEFDQHVERRVRALDTARRGYLVKSDLPPLCTELR